ncbi:unnamed protein product [Polarella glacialis]|uniref:Uncharacterized protein n=1 Tax=Polarella glacialis TaxID=89957 RepID=A0A813IBI9_POLGL|nr:unnamed protein product [Polarella glacialis]
MLIAKGCPSGLANDGFKGNERESIERTKEQIVSDAPSSENGQSAFHTKHRPLKSVSSCREGLVCYESGSGLRVSGKCGDAASPSPLTVGYDVNQNPILAVDVGGQLKPYP